MPEREKKLKGRVIAVALIIFGLTAACLPTSPDSNFATKTPFHYVPLPTLIPETPRAPHLSLSTPGCWHVKNREIKVSFGISNEIMFPPAISVVELIYPGSNQPKLGNIPTAAINLVFETSTQMTVGLSENARPGTTLTTHRYGHDCGVEQVVDNLATTNYIPVAVLESGDRISVRHPLNIKSTDLVNELDKTIKLYRFSKYERIKFSSN